MKSVAGKDAPLATVVSVTATAVRVLCPYCGDVHKHIKSPTRHYGPFWFAPACGLGLNPMDRERGYRFRLRKE